MKLFVLHLSDIHISSDRYPENPILDRTDAILKAVQSLFLSPEEISAAVMLVAGDIAYSGRQEEYDLARPFFDSLRAGLVKIFPSAQQSTVFLPGNHDCNFNKGGTARDKLINNPDMSALADGTVVDIATAVQDEFFAFRKHYSAENVTLKGLDRLFLEYRLSLSGREIVFRVLNSAWLSRVPESRNLKLPVEFLTTKLNTSPAPHLAVIALHHPYNWFEPDNAKALRRLLEESADVIFTGHEHAADQYTVSGAAGEQNEYFEGGVLQENGDSTTSSFNVLIVDLAANTQLLHHFVWDGTLYKVEGEEVHRPLLRNKYRLRNEYSPSDSFEETLSDADAAYDHPQKEKVTLEDVFLYPDFYELQDRRTKSTQKVLSGKEFVTHVLTKKQVVITAAERAGKTALSRTLFRDLRKNGKIPLLLDERTFRQNAIRRMQKTLDEAFGNQYRPELQAQYWQLNKEERAVIVDDFHLLPQSGPLRETLLHELKRRFEVVVIIGGYELRVSELVGESGHMAYLWDFSRLEVMAFGHRLRAEFIRKWYSLGRGGDSEDTEGLRRLIAMESTITRVLGHDLLPPYPVYLLLLLQQIELVNPHDVGAASYGRLYGAVLTEYLAKSGKTADLETKINYLNEFAYHLFDQQSDHLTTEDASTWHSKYCAKQLEKLDYDKLINELTASQVLLVQHEQVSFRYKAGFYYFVAQYLSEHISTSKVRKQIETLCGQTHRESSANIVIFLCHLSKDSIILDQVLATANGMFADQQETSLLKDAAFTAKLGDKPTVPELSLVDPEQNRLKALEHRDAEAEGVDRNEDKFAYRLPLEEEDQIDSTTVNINRAVKTIQIAGQILRNFSGRLEGSRKVELVNACYGLSLRILKSIYNAFESNESVLIEAARQAILNHHTKIDPLAAREAANSMVFGLLKLNTVAMIKQVSSAIGIDKLNQVFAQVLQKNPTLERRLLDLAIRLEQYSPIPLDKAIGLRNDVRNSLVVEDVLRHLLFCRMYYFSTPQAIRQQVCQEFGIKMVPALLDRDPKRN